MPASVTANTGTRSVSDVRCLSLHAGYACRHSGACCQADWEIEVPPEVVHAVETRAVIPVITTRRPFATRKGRNGPFTLARTSDGWCGFRAHARCSLHVTGGESLLPNACRHFPRIFLHDGRGWLLTLSHFCPTAAALLLDDGPVEVVVAERALALEDPREGLDAGMALPPLLRPAMLMDLESYARWEEAVVSRFVGTADPAGTIEDVAEATERIRGWHPSEGPLIDHVEGAFRAPSTGGSIASLSTGYDIVRSLTGPHPLVDVPCDFTRRWETIAASNGDALHATIGRYLAASTFANWIAYRGQGLRTIVEWLRACYDVLRVQLVRETSASRPAVTRESLITAIRLSDYIVVHTVDSQAFGRAAVIVEGER